MTVSYDQATRDELRDELRARDLPVSGNKDELIERLEEADEQDEGDDDGGDANGSRDSERSKDSGESRRLKPMQLARLAGAQLMQLTGRDLDGTSGIEQTDEGWCVLLEVVEVTRVPRAMDVLGLYEVIVDDDGDLVRYERIRRYGRSQPEDRE